MEESKKAELLKGMFSGATFTNSVVAGVVEKGATVCYNKYGKEEKVAKKPKPTSEQIAKALVSINGKGKAIDSQRAWLGACLLLGWKYNFPRNLSDCCDRIEQLPIDKTELEFQLKYESIRMYGSWKFVNENYEHWPTLTPRDDEKQIFEKCLSVAQTLDEEIEKLTVEEA